MCQITNPFSTYYYYFVGIEVIVYYQTDMENAFTGTGITHGTASFDISNDIQSIYNNHTVMRRLVFFGMNYFQKESKTSTPLDFNIVFGTRDIVYVASDNKQNISGFYLYFNTIITCQSD